MIALIEVLLLLTVFLTPLLGSTNLGFEQTKVIFFFQIITVTFTLWLLALKEGLIRIHWNNLSTSAAIFVTVLLLTSLIGIEPMGSILGKQPYLQGWMLYLYLYLFFLMVSSVKIKLKDWAICLATSATLVSLLAIEQWVSLHLLHTSIPTYAGRVVSTFGQSNLYSGFILLTLPFAFFLIKNPKFRWWVGGASVVSILGILISQSRAAILLLVPLVIFWLVDTFKINKKIAFSLVGTILIVAFVVSFSFSTGLILDEFQAPKESQWLFNNSPEKRINIWPIIADFIIKRSLQGYGLENLINIFPTYQRFHGDRSPAYYGIKNLVVDRSHNYTLDLLFFSGALGFLTWVFLIYQVFRKTKLGVLLISLVIYLVWIQLQIQSIVHLMYFWLLVGLINQESD